MPIKNFKISAHEPPGTLRYTGGQKPRKVTLEVIEYNSKKLTRRYIKSLDEMPQSTKNTVWLNVIGMHDTQLIRDIGRRFDIHEMDLEGVVNVFERSKVEEKDGYLLSLLKMVYLKEDWVIHEHIALILGKNMLITFQEHEGDVFDAVRARLEKAQGQIRTLGADFLFNSLIDNIIDQYYSIINYIEEKFAEAESNIIIENKSEMKKVYWLRKELLFLKNSLGPVQSSLKSIVENKPKHIQESTLPYISDVSDNVTQIMEEISTYREMVKGLYETQMSNAGNSMNKIMMTLTIFSVVFIPLSFLAGVFGMNFASVPGAQNPNSFIIFGIACVAIAAIMLIYFKLRKWF